jgi:hypothetical protein
VLQCHEPIIATDHLFSEARPVVTDEVGIDEVVTVLQVKAPRDGLGDQPRVLS